jgi:DNA repair photolyase
MIKSPIYEPKGAAKEYGDLAINIYTGCNHGCYYCFAPSVLRKDRETFSHVEPRVDIVESVRRQIEREHITGKLIHLCFTCDPYPADIDTTPTRDIIKIIKDSGNQVQILTKGAIGAQRDLDLLGEGDAFGVTISCNTDMARIAEPKASTPFVRLIVLDEAKNQGCKTWVSCEPVLDAKSIYKLITDYGDSIDLYKIGKLNYHPSDINWKEFGKEAERLCILHKRNYMIKDSLRKEME